MPDKAPEFLPQGDDNQERKLSTSDARQAVTIGRMRYVLMIGIALVVVLFALVYFLGP